VDPLTKPPAVRVEILTERHARELADELIRMTKDSEWDTWTVENLLADRPDKWHRSLIAYVDDRPAAWAIISTSGYGAHLHHLVVASDLRRKRLGELLVNEALKRNSDKSRLTLKVHPTNRGAVGFYHRLGFSETGISPSGYIEMSRDNQAH
jgi:ribosomal protein S18 acetylase RimI-like enzyme